MKEAFSKFFAFIFIFVWISVHCYFQTRLERALGTIPLQDCRSRWSKFWCFDLVSHKKRTSFLTEHYFQEATWTSRPRWAAGNSQVVDDQISTNCTNWNASTSFFSFPLLLICRPAKHACSPTWVFLRVRNTLWWRSSLVTPVQAGIKNFRPAANWQLFQVVKKTNSSDSLPKAKFIQILCVFAFFSMYSVNNTFS